MISEDQVFAAHKRYIASEAFVGALFGGAFGILFCFLAFGDSPGGWVGRSALTSDSVPQALGVALPATFFATVFTRKRVRTGRIAPSKRRKRLPRNVLLRAILVALVAAAGTLVLTASVLAAGPENHPFARVLVIKILIGMALGSATSGMAARAALSDK